MRRPRISNPKWFRPWRCTTSRAVCWGAERIPCWQAYYQWLWAPISEMFKQIGCFEILFPGCAMMCCEWICNAIQTKYVLWKWEQTRTTVPWIWIRIQERARCIFKLYLRQVPPHPCMHFSITLTPFLFLLKQTPCFSRWPSFCLGPPFFLFTIQLEHARRIILKISPASDSCTQYAMSLNST